MKLHAPLLFLALSPIGRAQIQNQKILASDAYQGQRFGFEVSVSGDWAVVGVRDDDQLGSQAGAAYLVQRRGGGFVESQKLFASDAQVGDVFGYSVAIDSATLVVGAMSEDPAGVFAAGSAYVFERVGANWTQTAKLNSSVLQSNATFGWSVDVHGDRIVVGARNESVVSTNSGAAYVFERNGAAWVQTARLLPSDGELWGFFGQDVAVWGDTILVGSDAGQGGSAYVYEFNGVAWGEVAKLIPSDVHSDSGFSTRLALHDRTAVFGARGHIHGGVSSGAAYVFERLGNSWVQTAELLPHAPVVGAGAGTDVGIDGDSILVGASNDPYTVTAHGAAYLFRRTPSGWAEHARLQASDAQDGDHLGGRVAIRDDTAVLGVSQADDLCPGNIGCNSGAVYVFDLAPDARQFGWCMSSAPCGNSFNIGGCLNSTGVGATLAAAGSSSVVRNELRFEVRDIQPNRNAIVFMGNGVGQAVLGDGLRVVASGTSGFYRYGVQLSGADGSFQQTGIVAKSQTFATPGHIQAGSVWNFQCWYRDPTGPCGKGTNVTNAVEVTFGP